MDSQSRDAGVDPFGDKEAQSFGEFDNARRKQDMIHSMTMGCIRANGGT